jgi:hypothetical protein
MATTVSIVEYAGLARNGSDMIPAPLEPVGTVQTAISLTASSQQSAALNAATSIVRVSVDAGGAHLRLQFGTNPTATQNSQFQAGQTVMDYPVTAGASLKVAVLTAA